MHRSLALLVTLLFAAAASAAPVPKEVKRKAAPGVVGTTWVGEHTGSDIEAVEYTFAEGGTLMFRYVKQPSVHGTGTWTQEAGALTFDVNDHYATFTLAYKDGVFDGTALNVKGVAWKLVMRPQDR